MPCRTTIAFFARVLRHLDWNAYKQALERPRAATRACGFSSKSHLAAMPHGQLAGASSLLEIEAGLFNAQSRHLDLPAARFVSPMSRSEPSPISPAFPLSM